MSSPPVTAERSWRPWIKRGVLALVSLVLLYLLYESADWRAVGRQLQALHPGFLTAALLLFVPQTLVSAWRWQRIAAPLATISFTEAVRQTLAASAMNLAMPSKLGEFSKAAMCGRNYAHFSGRVLLEKGADVAALAVCGLCAWTGAYGLAGLVLLFIGLLLADRFGRRRADPETASISLAALTGSSLLLWTLHLGQIDCMIRAVGVNVPVWETFARVPAAIFAGLLPVSLWGIGTRDAALVWLFDGLAPAAAMAVVGMLTALRYVVPGLIGIPLLGNYVSSWAARRSPAAGEAVR